jgi:hypothetical protein
MVGPSRRTPSCREHDDIGLHRFGRISQRVAFLDAGCRWDLVHHSLLQLSQLEVSQAAMSGPKPRLVLSEGPMTTTIHTMFVPTL